MSATTSEPHVTRRGSLPRRPLTVEQQRLVMEFEDKVPLLISYIPKWARQRIGHDDLRQLVWLSAAEAMQPLDPATASGDRFMATAFVAVRQRLWLAVRNLVKRERVWREMPALVDDKGGDPTCIDVADYRLRGVDPELAAWCDPDYAAQRQQLTWVARVLLCLRTVEGLSTAEAGECLGLSPEDAAHAERTALEDLAYLRGERKYSDPPADPTRRKDWYRGVWYEGSRRDSVADRFRRADAAGLCRKCNKVPRTGGRQTCETCAAKHRERENARRAASIAAGLCVAGCGRPTGGGRKCDECSRSAAVRDKLAYDARKAAGVCSECPAPAAPGQVRCLACIEALNVRGREGYARRKAERKNAAVA